MGPSRRHLLGAGAGAAAAMTAGTTGMAHGARGTRVNGGDRAVRAALQRLLPEHSDQIRTRVLPSEGGDRFRVSGRMGRIELAGTTPAVMLTGLHWYLKYTCSAHISWAGTRPDLPRVLPAPAQPHARHATVEHRFALNDTHDAYTAPYADWAHWERFLDVLALHGCNEALVTAGSEAVYHRLLQDFGYSDAQARAWIPAPSHQPWWLLQNMSEYGGPVSTRLLERRTELGRRIVGRMRELGMRPVLPGCFGTVPADFAERNPGGVTVPQGTWNGLPRPAWLDPRTEVFREVAAAYYAHQRELFGPVRHFKMDLLHEGGDPGDVPVPEAAEAVETALQTAHPGATWVILGWQDNPRRELLDGLAHKDRMLIVDGLSDLERVTDREQDWGGVPYAFGTIPNFGGRTTLGAKTHMWAERFAQWRDRPGSALTGTAYMPEATHRDPAAFELFSELAWRVEPVDRAAWFEGYARLRYGGVDEAARRAWAALRDTAYEIGSADGRPHDSVFAARPALTARSGTHFATHTPAFDMPGFDAALSGLLGVRKPLRRSDTYRYDVADAARQALANRSWLLIGRLRTAYAQREGDTFRRLSSLWLTLMRLSDEVAGTHRAFLLGPWLDDARRSADGDEERARLERTARTLITTWAGRPAADPGRLANYANRDWHGLIGGFHLPQWQQYLDGLADALDHGREPEPVDWYAVEEPWTRKRDEHPLRPVGDAHRTALRVHDVLARAPYQGSVTFSAEPRATEPGGTGELTAVFRNENGLRRTGDVEFTLSGPDATPVGPSSVPPVAPGGRAAMRWRFTAPTGEPSRPLEPLPYTLRVAYGPDGERRVSAEEHGRLFVAGPLDAELRTVSSNDAVFGQLGGRFAVDGAGRDLWRGTSEFGAVYREGALRDGGSVTVRVTSQEVTGGWARAGIVVGNRLAGEPGCANLAVTPANGAVLSYDADGDGALDSRRQAAGFTAPVLLRLSRDGASLHAEVSDDDGRRWHTVGSAAVPGIAAQQDAGLFMTAANGGSGARGTAEFDRWRVATPADRR